MKEQYKQVNLDYTQSRKKIKTTFEQQQQQSMNFQMSKFYNNDQLNIEELKNMLERAKINRVKTLPLQNEEKGKWQLDKGNKSSMHQLEVRQEKRGKIFTEAKLHEYTQVEFQRRFNDFQKDSEAETILQIIKNKQKGQKQQENASQQNTKRNNNNEPKQFIRNSPYESQQKEQTPNNNNHYHNNPINNNHYHSNNINNDIILKRKNILISRYPNKNKPILGIKYKTTLQPNPQSLSGNKITLKNQSNTNKSRLKHMKSSRNDSKLELSFQKGWDQFGTKEQLLIYQERISKLWKHYELLSQILQIIHDNLAHQKRKIAQYIQNVCSEMFQFIKDILQQLLLMVYSKKQSMFLQRLRKDILMSKIYEHLCIMFLSLQICLEKRAVSSYLINFIGYSSSNIIFVIRLMYLVYRVEGEFSLKEGTLNILNVIQMFQYNSYGAVITRIGEIITRVQQNNRVIVIVLNKLTMQFDKLFQQTINRFAKVRDFNWLLSAYSKEVYQFLAYQLVKNGIVGVFESVQIAPAPYLSLHKSKTIVIEPWLVLFFLKKGKIFLRPYTDTFLYEIGKHCNIVYWTDLMPEEIDPLVQKLPPGSTLYKYHCKNQKQNCIKILDRLGTDLQNTIIIDREALNYHYNRQNGLQLPWRGQLKDNMLFNLICLMKNMLLDSKPLVKSLSDIRYQMSFATHETKSKILRHLPFKPSSSSHYEENYIYPRAISKHSYHK